MVKDILNQFTFSWLNNYKEENNVVFKILQSNFNKIFEGEEPSIIKALLEGAKDYFKGEEIRSTIPCTKGENDKSDWVNKWYISKVNINGLKRYPFDKKNTVPIIDFDKSKCAIIFGWNGEGKTSLLEAIEYCLTGDVEERKRRNHAKAKDYLINSQSKKGYVEVQLYSPKYGGAFLTITRDIKGDVKVVESNTTPDTELFKGLIIQHPEQIADFYKKHFVERNRLENFILSKSKDLKARYGELLGVDEFYNFYNSLPGTTGIHNEEILKEVYVFKNQLEQLLATKEELMSKKIEAPQFNISEDEKELLKQILIEEGMSSNQEIELIVVQSEKILNCIGKKIKLEEANHEKRQKILEIKERLEAQLKYVCEYNKQLQQLERYIVEGDLLDFYEEALKVIKDYEKVCPLCGNVYDNDETVKKVNKRISELKSIKEVKKNISSVQEHIKTNSVAINILKESLADETLMIHDENAEEIKQSIALCERSLLQIPKECYLSSGSSLVANIQYFEAAYKQYIGENNKLTEALKQVDAKIKSVTEAVAKEEDTNNKKKKFIADYARLKKELDLFYENLIAERLNVLCNKILLYYNKIEEKDHLDSINTVMDRQGFQFIICKNGVQADPIRVLSEGQLRCFGFAILLAVAKEIKPDFLIFDDIVNAIDLEHRINIIDLLVEEQKTIKQIIVTTHDKLFREKLSYKLCGGNYNKLNTYYIKDDGYFVANTDDIILKNKVEEAMQKKDVRSALMNMRVWTENNIYSLAEGKVELVFHDEMRCYSLNTVFDAVTKYYSEQYPKVNIKDIHSYFMNNSKNMWGLLNQENHFWSEKNASLSNKELKEIYDVVYSIDILKEIYDLGVDVINEMSINVNKNKLKREMFTQYQLLEDHQFINADKWTEKFIHIKKYILAK